MSKGIKAVIAMLFCLGMCVSVSADVQDGAQNPDYATDYYMIVESADGGIDMYAQPDEDSEKLTSELIPNGTALHIEGEFEDKDGKRTWGYTGYKGMNGYVPLDDCKPADSRQEAIDSDLYISGHENVDYNADLDVTAYSEDGTQKLYQGPGEKYGEVPGARDIENGEKLHITTDAYLTDGSHWGKTTVDDTEGWINMDNTEEYGKTSVTPTPLEAVTVTPTPEVTETPAPTETPEPEETKELTESPAAEETEADDSANPAGADETSDDAENAEEGSGEDAAHLYENGYVWLGAVVVLALAGIMIYRKKKQ